MQDRYQTKIIEIAAEYGDIRLIKYMIDEQHAKIPSKWSSALTHAIKNNHKDVIKYLLENGMCINSDCGGAIDAAIASGNLYIFEFLANSNKTYTIHMNDYMYCDNWKEIAEYSTKYGLTIT